MPAAEATIPPSSGPSPKPSAMALDPTPKTVACTIAGDSSPIIAPNAGIKAPLKKLATTNATIRTTGVAAGAPPSKTNPPGSGPPVSRRREGGGGSRGGEGGGGGARAGPAPGKGRAGRGGGPPGPG